MLTSGTLAIKFKQMALDLKAETLSKLSRHLVGHALVKINDSATVRADQMVVAAFGADIGGTVFADVNGAHKIEVGEQF